MIAPSAQAILVVDDEYDIASTLDLALSSEGYQVRIASHGKEAIELLKDAVLPQLIISDIMMPIMSGYEFILKIKADPRTKRIPVLLMSAARPDYSQMSEDNIDMFMRKPFDLDFLFATVAEIMSRPVKSA